MKSNKVALAEFLGEYVTQYGTAHPSLKQPNKEIVIASVFLDGTAVRHFTLNGSTVISAEASTHDEAYARMIWHPNITDQRCQHLNF